MSFKALKVRRRLVSELRDRCRLKGGYIARTARRIRSPSVRNRQRNQAARLPDADRSWKAFPLPEGQIDPNEGVHRHTPASQVCSVYKYKLVAANQHVGQVAPGCGRIPFRGLGKESTGDAHLVRAGGAGE